MKLLLVWTGFIFHLRCRKLWGWLTEKETLPSNVYTGTVLFLMMLTLTTARQSSPFKTEWFKSSNSQWRDNWVLGCRSPVVAPLNLGKVGIAPDMGSRLKPIIRIPWTETLGIADCTEPRQESDSSLLGFYWEFAAWPMIPKGRKDLKSFKSFESIVWELFGLSLVL